MKKLSERIAHIIKIMEAVQKKKGAFDMRRWYAKKDKDGEFLYSVDLPEVLSENKNVEEFHTCGTAACLAGWCAVDVEVRKTRGGYDDAGERLLAFMSKGMRSRSQRDDMERTLIGLTYSDSWLGETVYGKSIDKVTVADVLKKLREWHKFQAYLDAENAPKQPKWLNIVE